MSETTHFISMENRRKVKDEFAMRGESIAEWARKNGFMPKHVYDLLNGRTSGKLGEARRAAILLGLKKGTIEKTA